ncbi:MAG TPA: glycosyltransferase family 39 protein [Bryobacteraceae bacterium]|nr:glycosyltransferase family 39 protein [Bryobacteraceae bacterium]
MAIIPHIGVQTDEAIFTAPLFETGGALFTLSVFHKKVPLMVMTYLGTVKTALYAIIFRLWEPSVYSLRVPVLLLGAISILAFYFFVRRAAEPSTALLAAALLATDSSYLIATTLDWGPVAIQHLCFLLGLLLILKAYQTSQLPPLGGGFFFLGLGLWDKALFVWMLSGAAIACLLLFLTEIRRFLTVRRIMAAGFFFLLGALPLFIYNVRQPLRTFRGNTTFTTDLETKPRVLRQTLNGEAFFAYLVEEDWAVKTPREPSTWFERTSVGLSRIVGDRRQHWYPYAYLGSLLLTPFLLLSEWRRPVLFLLIMMTVAWAQMLVTKGAGGGGHHTILLWPFPLMLIAITATWVGSRLGRWRSAFLWATGVLLCGSALLVNNYYVTQAVRNGAAGSWTNAVLTLAKRLPAYRAEKIFLIDWGLVDNLRLLSAGRLPIYVGSDPLMREEPTEEDIRLGKAMLESPNAILVGNTDDRQSFTDVNARMERLAARLGYQRELLETVYDFNGRPCFEVFRFKKSGGSAQR